MGASSSAAPEPQPLAGLPAVEAYLQERHKGKWHTTLNNHASTRPKGAGGALVRSVSECKSYTELLFADANWKCSLHLPNSFTPADGEGATQDEASENTCRKALAMLLLQSPSQVVLRPLRRAYLAAAPWARLCQSMCEGAPAMPGRTRPT